MLFVKQLKYNFEQMNIEKTNLVIKKINRLYELINNIGEASHTEKDLLKAYILDLYEAVVLFKEEESIEDLAEAEMLEELKKKKKTEKKIKKQIKKREEEEEEEEDFEEDTDDDEYIDGQDSDSDEEPDDTVEPVQEDKESKQENYIDPDMKELFSFSSSAELSDKLANSPIKDLTKAMGINEKIFTVNELFGNDQAELDNILLALNGLDNFEEAKSLLARSVAVKHNWTDSDNFKKAKNFIRLVRRRYL